MLAYFSNDSCSPSAGPPRPSCPAVAEIPLTMVSEEVEEQVHSIRGSSSANPVNSGRHAELPAVLPLEQDKWLHPVSNVACRGI